MWVVDCNEWEGEALWPLQSEGEGRRQDLGLELSLASVAEGGPSEYSITESLGHMGPQLVAGVCVYYLILFHSALC